MNKALLYLLLAFLPFERLLTIEFGGLTLKPAYIFGAALLSFGVFKQRYFSAFLKKIETADYLMLALVALSFLTAFWSLDFKRTIVLSLLTLFSAAIFFYFKYQKVDRTKAFEIVVWLGVATSVLGFWQFFGDSFGLPQNFTFLIDAYVKGVFPFPRIQSTFLEPLYFANFLILPIYLTALRYFKSNQKRYLLILLFVSTAFFLTLSRGAFYGLIGSFVVVALLAVLFCKKVFVKVLQSLFILMLSFGLSLFLIFLTSQENGTKSFTEQVQNVSYPTEGLNDMQRLTSRDFTQKVAKQTFLGKPFGIGFGAFGSLPEFEPLLLEGDHQTVNNQYLEVLVELGALGLLIYLSFGLAIFKTLFHRAIIQKDIQNIVFLGVGAAWSIQYLSFSALNILYFWIALGLFTNSVNKNT